MNSVVSVFMFMILLICILGVGAAVVGIVMFAITGKQTRNHKIGVTLLIGGIAVAAVFAILLGILGITRSIVEKNPFTGFESILDTITPSVTEDSDYGDDSDYGESKPAADSEGWYPAGEYLVGKDIPAGEYFVQADEDSYYADIIRKESKNAEDYLLYENCDTFRFITVKEGEYFEVQHCSFISSDQVEPITPSGDGYYYTGEYRVGIDIPAGDYVVLPDGRMSNPYVSCDTNSLHDYDYRIFSHYINGTHVYITVADGDYLKLDEAKLAGLEEAPTVEPDDQGRYAAGMYKIGRDVPADTYLVVPYDSEESLFFEVFYELRSRDCVFNEYTETFTYVTLEEGYILTDRCYLIPADKSPVIEKEGDSYAPGCYMVGKDIPAGTYEITAKLGASYPNYGITDKPQGSCTDYEIHNYLKIISKTSVQLFEGDFLIVEDATFKEK